MGDCIACMVVGNQFYLGGRGRRSKQIMCYLKDRLWRAAAPRPSPRYYAVHSAKDVACQSQARINASKNHSQLRTECVVQITQINVLQLKVQKV